MSASGKRNEAKKKVRYVPSRYKQAAEKVSNQSTLSKVEGSTFLKSSSDSQGLQESRNVSENVSSSSKHSTSEDSRGMTSTPTSSGKLPLPLLDASAVTGADGVLTVPSLKGRIGPLSADTVKRNLTKHYKSQVEKQSRRPVVASYRDKKNDGFNQKLADAEVDLLYSYYLQAAFLESEVKKALEARSSNAMETLHKLFVLVLQHLYKAKSKRTSLKIISSLIEIHDHCEKQKDILKPVFEVIPTFEEQFKSLAEAVNCSKNKLHVKDVILPEPGCEGEINDLLLKMSEFINGFFELFPNYKDIISSSDALERYTNVGELITEALTRGLDLLVEARDLCFSEASLALGGTL